LRKKVVDRANQAAQDTGQGLSSETRSKTASISDGFARAVEIISLPSIIRV